MHCETYIELSRVEVADKARQLWKADGTPSGRSLEYWLQAEVELLNASDGRLRNNGALDDDPPRGMPQTLVPKTSASGVAKRRARRNGAR